jgi:hypothetical protein
VHVPGHACIGSRPSAPSSSHLNPPPCFRSNSKLSILFICTFGAILFCPIPSPRGSGQAHSSSPGKGQQLQQTIPVPVPPQIPTLSCIRLDTFLPTLSCIFDQMPSLESFASPTFTKPCKHPRLETPHWLTGRDLQSSLAFIQRGVFDLGGGEQERSGDSQSGVHKVMRMAAAGEELHPVSITRVHFTPLKKTVSCGQTTTPTRATNKRD